MIRIGALLHTLGLFLLALAGTMFVPFFFGLIIGDDLTPFLFAIAITGIIGLLFFRYTSPSEGELSQREAVMLVFVVWIASSTFGCLPSICQSISQALPMPFLKPPRDLQPPGPQSLRMLKFSRIAYNSGAALRTGLAEWVSYSWVSQSFRW